MNTPKNPYWSPQHTAKCYLHIMPYNLFWVILFHQNIANSLFDQEHLHYTCGFSYQYILVNIGQYLQSPMDGLKLWVLRDHRAFSPKISFFVLKTPNLICFGFAYIQLLSFLPIYLAYYSSHEQNECVYQESASWEQKTLGEKEEKLFPIVLIPNFHTNALALTKFNIFQMRGEHSQC